MNLPIISAPNIPIPKLPDASSLASNIPNVSSLVPKIDIPKIDLPKIELNIPKVELPKFPAPKLPNLSIPKLPVPSIDIPKIKLPDATLPPLPEGIAGITGGLKKSAFKSVQSKIGSIVKKVG